MGALWLGLVLALCAGLYVYYCYRTLPDFSKAVYVERQAGVKILAADGREITSYGALFAEPVDVDDLPPYVYQAVIDTEDRRFFKHGGVNYDGLSISLLEGDQLLESGKTYILIAASEADGRLGQGMPNSSIELDLSQRQSYSTKSEYSSYCEYVRDEVECERTRYHSMYENSSESRIDE